MEDNKKFSIVIPTMWRSNNILKMLSKYQESEYVGEIILIDNNPDNKLEYGNYDKLIYYTENKNLYVNPSWNLGYGLSNYNLILANDDILIEDIDLILKLILENDYDIIGVKMGKKTNEIKISEIQEFPLNHFGCFMYIKNYTYIPEQIKIWYGDNLLFYKSNRKGLLENCGIYGNSSSTVKDFKNHSKEEILEKDKINYESIIKNEERFNITIRTSGRKNYFKNCIESVKKYYPSAKLHITLDDINDLEYVEKYAIEFDYSYYLINKSTVEKIASKIKLNRRPFIYNYYFNIVKPFLNGWCMYLDDDDMLIRTPEFNWLDKNVINLYRTDVIDKIVPSESNFGKRPVLNDISTLCVLVHSSRLIDWVPNRGGDYDFISGLYDNNIVKWHHEMNSSCQTGGNFGKRNDIKNEPINGFYLNLSKRIDRKEKMEELLKTTKHNIRRFEAIDGSNLKITTNFIGSIKNSQSKQYATYLSHLNMLKTAKENKWDKVIILEDDITISDDFDTRLDYLMEFLPKDWKIVYLGFNGQPNTDIERVNKWVYSVRNVYGCFGMLINGNFLDEFITIIENGNVAIDEIIKNDVLPNYKCYAFIPFLLYVNDDFSDLWERNRVLHMIKNLYLPSIEIDSDYVVDYTHPFGVTKKIIKVNKVVETKYVFKKHNNEKINDKVDNITDIIDRVKIKTDNNLKQTPIVENNKPKQTIKENLLNILNKTHQRVNNGLSKEEIDKKRNLLNKI